MSKVKVASIREVNATLRGIGEHARGEWPASALDELWAAAQKIHARAPAMLKEEQERAEWREKYGHALAEAGWTKILSEWIGKGCVLVGIRSDAPREARPYWYHEALLRQPGETRAARYTTVTFSEDRVYRQPYLMSGMTLRVAREEVVSYIFTEGTLLPAFKKTA
jgi:hypothetical protein